MAWLFSLSVECGSPAAATHVARFLDGRSVGDTTLRARADGDWVIALPQDVNLLNNNLLTDALADAPPFRYALAGLEVDRAREWDELPGETFDDPAWGSIVMSDEAWLHAGQPAGFAAFRPAYRVRRP